MLSSANSMSWKSILALSVVLLTFGACTDLQQVFNPTFLESLGIGGSVTDLPGEAPAIVMEVENGTQWLIEVKVTWRDSDNEIQELTRAIASGKKYAEALICPIKEITLGDVSDLKAVGAIVRLGTGASVDPYMEVEPFGVLLQQGVNYDCGDKITFKVLPSDATVSGYQVFAFIRHSGAQTDTTDGNSDSGDENP